MKRTVTTKFGNVEYNVVTNWHPRHITYGWELPANARKEFDYLSEEELESREFVQYRGDWFDLGDVLLAPDSIKALGFDGFNSDSYWSGMAFKYFDEEGNLLDGGDSVVVARIHW